MTQPSATPLRKTKDEILSQLSSMLPFEGLHAAEREGQLHLTLRRDQPLSEDEQRQFADWLASYDGKHCDTAVSQIHLFEVDIPDAHVRKLTPLESALEKLDAYFTAEEREALRVYELDKAIVE